MYANEPLLQIPGHPLHGFIEKHGLMAPERNPMVSARENDFFSRLANMPKYDFRVPQGHDSVVFSMQD